MLLIFKKIYFIFLFLLFFHVSGCSGKFHVPGFIDGPINVLILGLKKDTKFYTVNRSNICIEPF